MAWSDVGNWLASDGPPWWATLGVPVLTYWIGQRTSASAAETQRKADADQRQADRDAETIRLREARDAEEKSRAAQFRAGAFADALDSIALLTSELVKSGIKEYGEWEDSGSNTKTKRQIHNPDHAADPAALHRFVASVSKLRLYNDHHWLDAVDSIANEVRDYIAYWPDLDYRLGDPNPLINSLNDLAKKVAVLYRI